MDKRKTLKLLELYGADAFNEVPDRSALKGKQFCGYLYSPYFFRRYTGHQFEKLVAIWGKTNRKIDVIDFIACGVCIDTVASVDGVATVEEATEKLVDEICSRYEYSWMAVLDLRCTNPLIKTSVVRTICSHKGMELETVEKICTDYQEQSSHFGNFPNFSRIPREMAEMMAAGQRAKLEDFMAAMKMTEIERKIFAEERFAVILAKTIQKAAEIIGTQEGNIVITCSSSQNILLGGAILSVRPGYAHLALYRKLSQEIRTLAILEQHADMIFEERKQFLPLELVNEIFQQKWESYKEAFEALPDKVRHTDFVFLNSLDRDALEDYRIKYVLAGYFYWRRNQIAFCGGSVGEFEEARNEIPTWDESQLRKEIEKLADELIEQYAAKESASNGKSQDLSVF